MRGLSTQDPGFAAAFAGIVADRRESNADVAEAVRGIIADVRARGDAALADYTARFDHHGPGDDADWRIAPEACAAAFARLAPPLRAALELAAARIEAFHRGQMPHDSDHRDAVGVRMGARWRPVDAAGLYVPGGRAAYPSSLLMNAIPAKIAGVARLVVATPTPAGPDGKAAVNPLVLAAAHLAGVDEVWRVGGAQAVAALAYGTARIAPVDVITGPGNAYVAEAKRQLFGVVGIDMVAGPSEIVLIADGDNNPAWLAADLLAQAEHDPEAQSILITDDARLAEAVRAAVAAQLAGLDPASPAQASWARHGVIILADLAREAAALVNALAPEHLAISTRDPEAIFAEVRHAGSVFLGRYSPEAVGDYVAGPNHVLPTARRARFASGLSVLDFMKRTSFIGLDAEALAAIGPAAVALAEAEGLPAHAASVALRLAAL